VPKVFALITGAVPMAATAIEVAAVAGGTQDCDEGASCGVTLTEHGLQLTFDVSAAAKFVGSVE